jgi:UDP-N-acetylglucosamine acyltransferase
MPPAIHPTAIIEDGAVIGAGCEIHAYALITRHCRLEDGVIVHPFAVVGGDPQDLGFDPTIRSSVHIGARTVIREHVTIHRGTRPDATTQIGADAFLMAGSHVAHDCVLADRVILANAVLLAGHVHVGERAFLGGGLAIHQFCRIGESAMVGGLARITRDIPPFTMATERDELIGLNKVGLKRRGFSRTAIHELKEAFRRVYDTLDSPRERAAALLREGQFETAEAQRFLAFFDGGRRGVIRPRRAALETGDDTE